MARTASNQSPIESMEAWQRLAKKERQAWAKRIAQALGPAFLEQTIVCGVDELAQVLLKGHDLLFALIPGGTFQMGISKSERDSALALTFQEEPETRDGIEALSIKTKKVAISPFLCARSPIGPEAVEALLGKPVEAEEENVPLRFAPQMARKLWVKGAAHGLRLISSPEWEYVVREGGRCGWQGGQTAKQCIAAHAAVYGAPFDVNDRSAWTSWGIWGMPWGDWVAEKPTSKAASPTHSRGGGAMSYPWQSDEIAGCLSGLADSSGLDDYCVRFAISLPKSI